MKKVLSVLTVILLVAAMCITAFAADTITLNPSATEAAVDDEITVSFNVAEGLTGVDSILKYDTEYLELVSATPDNDMAQLNTNNAGEIHVAWASNEPAQAGPLFTAKFKVKKAGAEISATDNEVLDADGNDISDTVEIASITIADKAGEATTSSSDETTTKASDNNGSNGGNGGNGGSGNGGSGSNTNKNPKTGNTPVVGAAAAVLVASAAVIVALKKKNED